MKKNFVSQSALTIKDFYPDYNEKYSNSGLDRQELFLFKLFSTPIHCPACKKAHTINELKYSSPDFGTSNKEKLFCPNTDKELIHETTMFGGENYLREIIVDL